MALNVSCVYFWILIDFQHAFLTEEVNFRKSNSWIIQKENLPFLTAPEESSLSNECALSKLIDGGGANILDRLRDSNWEILRATSSNVRRTPCVPWSFSVKLRSFGSWHQNLARAASLLRSKVRLLKLHLIKIVSFYVHGLWLLKSVANKEYFGQYIYSLRKLFVITILKILIQGFYNFWRRTYNQ